MMEVEMIMMVEVMIMTVVEVEAVRGELVVRRW